MKPGRRRRRIPTISALVAQHATDVLHRADGGNLAVADSQRAGDLMHRINRQNRPLDHGRDTYHTYGL